MKPPLVSSCLKLFAGRQFKPTVIMVSSSLLICLWRVYGSRGYYTEHLASHFTLAGDPVATAAWYSIGMCFLLLGLVPLLLVKLVFRQRLTDYGVQAGNVKVGLLLVVAAAPVILLISHATAPSSIFRAEYPLNHHADQSSQAFAVHAASLLFFYLGWEFHFRGFLQFGLAESMGRRTHSAYRCSLRAWRTSASRRRSYWLRFRPEYSGACKPIARSRCGPDCSSTGCWV